MAISLSVDTFPTYAVFHITALEYEYWSVSTASGYGKSGSGSSTWTENFLPGLIIFSVKDVNNTVVQSLGVNIPAAEYVPPPPPPPSPIPPELPPDFPSVQQPGQDIIGYVGTRCDIVVLHKYTHDVWYYKNRLTGTLGTQRRTKGDAFIDANKDQNCFIPLPPTTEEKLASEIQERKTADEMEKNTREELVKSLSGLLANLQKGFAEVVDLVSNISARIQKLENELTGIILGVVIGSFVYILESVLESEKK